MDCQTISILVILFDSKLSESIDFEDFLAMVLTRTDPEIRFRAVAKRDNYDFISGDSLSPEIEFALARFFLKAGDYFKAISNDRVVSQLIIDDHAFQRIDVGNKGFICFEDLSGFLKKSKLSLKDRDIASVLRMMDICADGRVDKNEFNTFISILSGREVSILSLKENHSISPNTPLISVQASYTVAPEMQNERQNRYSSLRNSERRAESPSVLKELHVSEIPSLRADKFSRTTNQLFKVLQHTYGFEKSSLKRDCSKENHHSSKIRTKSPHYFNMPVLAVEEKRLPRAPGTYKKAIQKKSIQEVSSILTELFNSLISVGKAVELVRQDLALRPDYNASDHFKMIAAKNSFISDSEFSNFLKRIGIFEDTNKSAICLLSSYPNKKIDIATFNKLIAPSQKEYKVLLDCRGERVRPGAEIPQYESFFTNETRRLIKIAFYNILEQVRLDQEIRNNVTLQDEEIQEFFYLIKKEKEAKLSKEDVVLRLTNNSFVNFL